MAASHDYFYNISIENKYKIITVSGSVLRGCFFLTNYKAPLKPRVWRLPFPSYNHLLWQRTTSSRESPEWSLNLQVIVYLNIILKIRNALLSLDMSAVFCSMESEIYGLFTETNHIEQHINATKQNSKDQFNFDISPATSILNIYIVYTAFLFSE